jgi:hypothetical protein
MIIRKPDADNSKKSYDEGRKAFNERQRDAEDTAKTAATEKSWEHEYLDAQKVRGNKRPPK